MHLILLSGLKLQGARLHVGVQACTECHGLRNVGDQLALFGGIEAALHAVPGLDAATACLRYRAASPAQFLRTGTQQLVHAVVVIFIGAVHVEHTVELSPGRSQFGQTVARQPVALRPVRQPVIGGAVGVSPVVHRGTAHVVARQQQRATIGRRLEAAVAGELAVHVELVLVEVGFGVVATPLQNDDAAPGSRELFGQRGATAARADDANIGLNGLACSQVLALEDAAGHWAPPAMRCA